MLILKVHIITTKLVDFHILKKLCGEDRGGVPKTMNPSYLKNGWNNSHFFFHISIHFILLKLSMKFEILKVIFGRLRGGVPLTKNAFDLENSRDNMHFLLHNYKEHISKILHAKFYKLECICPWAGAKRSQHQWLIYNSKLCVLWVSVSYINCKNLTSANILQNFDFWKSFAEKIEGGSQKPWTPQISKTAETVVIFSFIFQ